MTSRFLSVRTLLALAVVGAAPALLAEELRPDVAAVAAPQDAVRMLFRSAQGFGVAQGATLPISVVHAASFETFESAGVASNTFATVFGQVGGGAAAPAQEARLLPDVPVNDWSDDFVDGVAPTSLDGVRVLVNGIEGFISFIGRAEDIGTANDQINFIAPDDDALGPVMIEVYQGEDRVAASMVNRGEAAPGLFVFGGTYAAAVSPAGEFIAPPGTFGDAVQSRAAAGGETILLFGSGFGSTEPAIPAGRIVTERSDIPGGELMVTVGGMPATVVFAGLAPNLAGLYQFNITLPALPDGEHEVVITRSGQPSQGGVLIPIANP